MKKLTEEVRVELCINAKLLWQVLTETKFTTAYMFNCSVESDWVKGSAITWQGNYQGYQAFQKGEILAINPNELIKYSTFDPNFGISDIAENYIHVTYLIKEIAGRTILTIINETFDGNDERMKHVRQGWQMVINEMKKVVNAM
jgi:uncharacterized protein YndB with AHSA1/START domain